MSVDIKNLTRQHLKVGAGVAFSAIASDVLPGWDISLVFVGPTRARDLNKQLRGKEYTPNVLSYALDSTNGEIIICLAEAQKQAPAYGMNERQFVLYLFIHGVLHLKGWAHGATMEQCERKLVAKFVTRTVRPLPNETTHSHRNRHRHVPSKDGRRRRAR
ncbi:MAG: rRNA maturation RNase YbeY [Candidatus Paceibacterota bacterium]|jgi:probable rRNA maturation factor